MQDENDVDQYPVSGRNISFPSFSEQRSMLLTFDDVASSCFGMKSGCLWV
jgi:hypothetical protein